MIRSVADLLKKFIDRERQVLDAYEITHGPTIGSMYEGLTRTILDKTIPVELGIQVVSGFAFLGSQLSGEIDCMVVRGDGEKIPYTEKYKWHISNVIAVLEIKKTLSADEIADSYDHLRAVSRLYAKYVESDEAVGVNIDLSMPRRVFSQMTGLVPPTYSQIITLPYDLHVLHEILVCEYLGPVRIVMGHHGWKKEKTLRDHIVKLLQARIANPYGMGAGSFPQLIIGGEFALVKLNGLPYVGPLIDGMWPVLASTCHNPLRILLELIFTKIDSLLSTTLAMDDSIEEEAMSCCLRAKAVKHGEVQGWEYMYDNLSSESLKERGANSEWQPTELTLAQFTIVNRLCAEGEVRIDDPDFMSYVSREPGGQSEFVDGLVRTRLVAVEGQTLRLTTVNCTTLITNDGKYTACENSSGQMEVWLEQKLGKPRSEWKTLFLPSSSD